MDDHTKIGWRAHLCLGLLLIVYIFNFIDRQILSILAQPIKAELNLTDAQLGWLGGFAFALFYTLVGIPAALYANRIGRTKMIAAALMLWSAATAFCGLASSYAMLAIGRFGVGIGEAGGVAPAQSLISDLYPPQHRAKAMGVFSMGVPLGSGLGIMFGGLVAAAFDWRWAFIVIGLAGVIFAPVFFWGVKDGCERPVDTRRTARDALGAVIRNRSLWLISLGASLSSVIGYGLMFWLPSVFMRSFKATLMSASIGFGLIVLIGGVIGIAGGAWLADKLGAKSPRSFVFVPAVAYLLCIPAYALVLLDPDFGFSTGSGFALLLLAQALGLVWMGPVMASLHHVVAREDRALASAVFLFVTNVIGLGFGSWILGLISDYLSHNYAENALKMAVTWGLGFYVLGAACFLLASRTLAQDWKSGGD
ncbi:MFS transporter [Asticcacaulis sp. BYS171W]|uniref:MFS transporter n=1 Tax=Asticcacaulis aquaticus TaxID=2984212 RepID=A0ABT5HRD7_9CAUL|nr:MFS transporter [Asticcacaulis aquaticus]MDC7682637.1 MFS transporter [Asticcacaulis aquaticus]